MIENLFCQHINGNMDMDVLLKEMLQSVWTTVTWRWRVRCAQCDIRMWYRRHGLYLLTDILFFDVTFTLPRTYSVRRQDWWTNQLSCYSCQDNFPKSRETRCESESWYDGGEILWVVPLYNFYSIIIIMQDKWVLELPGSRNVNMNTFRHYSFNVYVKKVVVYRRVGPSPLLLQTYQSLYDQHSISVPGILTLESAALTNTLQRGVMQAI